MPQDNILTYETATQILHSSHAYIHKSPVLFKQYAQNFEMRSEKYPIMLSNENRRTAIYYEELSATLFQPEYNPKELDYIYTTVRNLQWFENLNTIAKVAPVKNAQYIPRKMGFMRYLSFAYMATTNNEEPDDFKELTGIGFADLKRVRDETIIPPNNSVLTHFKHNFTNPSVMWFNKQYDQLSHSYMSGCVYINDLTHHLRGG